MLSLIWDYLHMSTETGDYFPNNLFPKEPHFIAQHPAHGGAELTQDMALHTQRLSSSSSALATQLGSLSLTPLYPSKEACAWIRSFPSTSQGQKNSPVVTAAPHCLPEHKVRLKSHSDVISQHLLMKLERVPRCVQLWMLHARNGQPAHTSKTSFY